jgi:N-acyl-D-amino-acid deacylase
VGEVFGELIKVSPGVRKAAYRDQEWRTRAFEDLEHNDGGMKPRWETFEVSESERFPELLGRRVTDIARERDASPLDVMCELSLAEDLTTRFRAYIANDDPDEVGRLLTEDHVVLGLTDAGAHVDQLCDAPLPTDQLAGEPADMFGFEGRGYLRPGYAADVTVFDPATVAPGPQRRLRDLPADGERLTNEEPSGLRHVLVNGTPIRTDERQLDLERLPGTRPRLV